MLSGYAFAQVQDSTAIHMWSGFEPESISDAHLLAALGLDYPGADIPNWVMTELEPLVVNGSVTVDEFRTAVQYVLQSADTPAILEPAP